MTNEQLLKNLSVPTGKVDVVLDTDTFNEIDDQFAIAYLLRSQEKLNTKAIYAAPFFNDLAESPEDGMEKSFHEIHKLLELMGEQKEVYRGSGHFMVDEKTPVISPAADDLSRRALQYTPDNPLYVVAIGAITNIASAILLEPTVAENTIVIWLGGHARHYHDTDEFNMSGDIAAARVVMNSGVPFIQFPCQGVVSEFSISGPELEYWLLNKNPLADYLAQNTINAANRYACDKPWTRVIWDVTAVAWLLNHKDRFMHSRIVPMVLPGYDYQYHQAENAIPMRYIYKIKRDALMEDLLSKILQ